MANREMPACLPNNSAKGSICNSFPSLRRIRAIAVILLLCLLENAGQAQKPIRRVAVLEFQNITGEKTLDKFTVGIPDTISNELARSHRSEEHTSELQSHSFIS